MATIPINLDYPDRGPDAVIECSVRRYGGGWLWSADIKGSPFSWSNCDGWTVTRWAANRKVRKAAKFLLTPATPPQQDEYTLTIHDVRP